MRVCGGKQSMAFSVPPVLRFIFATLLLYLLYSHDIETSPLPGLLMGVPQERKNTVTFEGWAVWGVFCGVCFSGFVGLGCVWFLCFGFFFYKLIGRWNFSKVNILTKYKKT